MDYQKISDEVSVTGQIRPRDLPLVHAQGFRSVICNRPDGEADDQPLFEAIDTAAQALGVIAHYVPVASTGPEPDQAKVLAQLWPDLPKPVLAYCRSGARSTALIRMMNRQS